MIEFPRGRFSGYSDNQRKYLRIGWNAAAAAIAAEQTLAVTSSGCATHGLAHPCEACAAELSWRDELWDHIKEFALAGERGNDTDIARARQHIDQHLDALTSGALGGGEAQGESNVGSVPERLNGDALRSGREAGCKQKGPVARAADTGSFVGSNPAAAPTAGVETSWPSERVKALNEAAHELWNRVAAYQHGGIPGKLGHRNGLEEAARAITAMRDKAGNLGVSIAAPRPMQGLADWLRAQAQHPCASDEDRATWKAWAREVDAASGVGVDAPSVSDAWNQVRAEARALARGNMSIAALLTAAEEYGNARAAGVKEGGNAA